MRLGIHLVARPERDASGGLAFSDAVSRADAYGFERITTGDVQGNHLECYTALATMACRTERAAIGPLTTHGVTRDPGVAAAAVASLAELSDGRVFFVLGRGDGSVRNAGLKPATVSSTREYFVAVRDLLRTGNATYRDRQLRLAWPSPAPRQVRIYMVAEGPRMLELAASIADGAYVGTGLSADVFEATTALLRSASERAGRDFDEFDVWWATRCAVGETHAAAVAAVRESLSSMGNHALRGDYGAKLVPAELHEPLAEYHRRYDYGAKNAVGGVYSNADLMDELGLTAYFLDRFGVVGTPDEVVARLGELQQRGFANVHLGAEGANALDLLGRDVLPRVGGWRGRSLEHRDD